jgi:hypothetical protein
MPSREIPRKMNCSAALSRDYIIINVISDDDDDTHVLPHTLLGWNRH